MTIDGSNPPPVGAHGTLSKMMKTNFAGMSVSANVDIGEVTVKSQTAKGAVVTVDKLLLDATVNGKPVDPFTKGAETTLQWKE